METAEFQPMPSDNRLVSADKPVSRILSPARKRGGDHSSSPAIARGIVRPTRELPAASSPPTKSGTQERHYGAGSPSSPIWSCSVWGLPCRDDRSPRGALLLVE
jgi:hypothetical protein